MAARKTTVPGEVEVKTETPQASTETTTEVITPDGNDDQSTNGTSSLGELVEPIDAAQITQILENQCRIENKIDQLLKAGGIQTVKKKRWVEGKHGLEHKEI